MVKPLHVDKTFIIFWNFLNFSTKPLLFLGKFLAIDKTFIFSWLKFYLSAKKK